MSDAKMTCSRSLMKTSIVLLAAFLSLSGMADQASSYTQIGAQSLLDACENYGTAKAVPALSRKQGFCEGYIFGVVESMANQCIPHSTEKLTIIETVRSHLKRNGDERLSSAGPSVSQAISVAWPCSQK